MPYFEDLTEYIYTKNSGTGLVNVGWLDSVHPFNRGEVDQEIVLRIADLCRNPVNRMRGFHRCEMCKECPVREPVGENGQVVTLGDAEIHIQGRHTVYVCPTLIYHYIVRHKYRPPEEFVDAVRLTGNGSQRRSRA
jgi:hypothetical protein